MSPEEYVAADAAGLLAAFEGQDEAARARAWEGAARRVLSSLTPDLPEPELSGRVAAQAAFCVLAGPPSAYREHAYMITALPVEVLVSGLAQRPAQWRAGLMAEVLRRWRRPRDIEALAAHLGDDWAAIRAGVQAGLLPPEPREEYLALMVRGVAFNGSIIDALRSDRALLQDELWELFEVAPLVQSALLAVDRRIVDPEYTWAGTMVRLAAAGEIPPSDCAMRRPPRRSLRRCRPVNGAGTSV